MHEHDAQSHRRFNPFLMAAAVLGLAFFAQQSYRLLRSEKHTKYKSRSRHPQIARWESEGGMVPEVQSLQNSSPKKATH